MAAELKEIKIPGFKSIFEFTMEGNITVRVTPTRDLFEEGQKDIYITTETMTKRQANKANTMDITRRHVYENANVDLDHYRMSLKLNGFDLISE